jgi:hypothetical protein
VARLFQRNVERHVPNRQILELVVLVVVTGTGVAMVGAWIRALVRRRLRSVQLPLACPRTGARVDCAILYDDESEKYVDVLACSAHPRGAPPCDQACRRLLNTGWPLCPDAPQGNDASSVVGRRADLAGAKRGDER